MIEELKFHFSNGKVVDDLKNYVKEYLKKYPNVELFIGTDSQKKKKKKKKSFICNYYMFQTSW